MKQKLKELITNSKVLNHQSREIYLKLLDFLPDQQLGKLLEIFTRESEGIQAIQQNKETNKKELDKKYLSELENFFKKEQKEAIKKEEEEEKTQSEEILKKLEET